LKEVNENSNFEKAVNVIVSLYPVKNYEKPVNERGK
jgi:hypothetical protein